MPIDSTANLIDGPSATSPRMRRDGDTEPCDGADQRQEHAFGEQLTNQVAARRTDRRADRHLARAGDRAREHQVRDVGAGNQQDEAYRAEQDRAGPVAREPLRTDRTFVSRSSSSADTSP